MARYLTDVIPVSSNMHASILLFQIKTGVYEMWKVGLFGYNLPSCRLVLEEFAFLLQLK